jgi:hypothetical protein
VHAIADGADGIQPLSVDRTTTVIPTAVLFWSGAAFQTFMTSNEYRSAETIPQQLDCC